ncbi:hypothetical protein HMPREF9374_0264 [Desmospora sp. 8437]|nr:hypothetical protein HMPREF9374_0264 [Desmospora sp. 8437]
MVKLRLVAVRMWTAYGDQQADRLAESGTPTPSGVGSVKICYSSPTSAAPHQYPVNAAHFRFADATGATRRNTMYKWIQVHRPVLTGEKNKMLIQFRRLISPGKRGIGPVPVPLFAWAFFS